MTKCNILFCICLFAAFLLARTQEDELCAGARCASDEICQIAICTPYCPEGEPCPHEICGAYCTPAPVTTEQPTEIENEYCAGVTCAAGQICEVAMCTPMCVEGQLCPQIPCDAYCVPAPVTSEQPTAIEDEYCAGVTCAAGQICQVAMCTPMCVEGQLCPQIPCAAYCVPASLTSDGTTETDGRELCDGQVCSANEVCQEVYCTPFCVEGEPCPHDPCGKFCLPNTDATSSTIKPPTAAP